MLGEEKLCFLVWLELLLLRASLLAVSSLFALWFVLLLLLRLSSLSNKALSPSFGNNSISSLIREERLAEGDEGDEGPKYREWMDVMSWKVNIRWGWGRDGCCCC